MLSGNSNKLHAAASLEKLIVIWPVTKFPDFYGTCRLIIMLVSVCHWFLLSAT